MPAEPVDPDDLALPQQPIGIFGTAALRAGVTIRDRQIGRTQIAVGFLEQRERNGFFVAAVAVVDEERFPAIATPPVLSLASIGAVERVANDHLGGVRRFHWVLSPPKPNCITKVLHL